MSDGVFTTQVDEDTLDAATKRQQQDKMLIKIDQPDKKETVIIMSDVVMAKAQQQYVDLLILLGPLASYLSLVCAV